MQKFLFIAIVGSAIILILFKSCSDSSSIPSNNSKSLPTNPFETLQLAFVGSPDPQSIKNLVEGIEQKYKLPATNDEALKIGNVAVVLREQSKVGVTEMDILKYVYQHGDPADTFTNQAAVSSVYLESTK